MQTFLPYASYTESARCLDNKRLGKQRVECKQILRALGVPVGGETSEGWRHHPAVIMWRGYEYHLCLYAIAMCMEWQRRGFRDSLMWQFILSAASSFVRRGKQRPPFIDDERFHRSHRSNLLRKDPKHYGNFNWGVSPDLPYVWPSKEVSSAGV